MWDKINNEYFMWLYNWMCDGRYSEGVSYKKLLMFLHNVEFRYSIPNDGNRAEDGIDLRYRFSLVSSLNDTDTIIGVLDGPCSVLEMMIALANRCEEDCMDDPVIENRTTQWFWNMIVNLGLGAMTDDKFDRRYVRATVEKFLDRDYEPNGKGGLFTVRGSDCDLRTVEIWYQLCWYLDGIT